MTFLVHFCRPGLLSHITHVNQIALFKKGESKVIYRKSEELAAKKLSPYLAFQSFRSMGHLLRGWPEAGDEIVSKVVVGKIS